MKIFAKLRIVKNPQETERKLVSSVFEYKLCLKRMLKQKKLLIGVVFFSMLYQVALSSVPYFIILAFGGTMSWFDALTTTVFIYSAITFVPTPGNSGAAEGSFYGVFSILTEGHIFWAMLVWRFLVYYLYIIWGIGIYFHEIISRKITKKEKNKN